MTLFCRVFLDGSLACGSLKLLLPQVVARQETAGLGMNTQPEAQATKARMLGTAGAWRRLGRHPSFWTAGICTHRRAVAAGEGGRPLGSQGWLRGSGVRTCSPRILGWAWPALEMGSFRSETLTRWVLGDGPPKPQKQTHQQLHGAGEGCVAGREELAPGLHVPVPLGSTALGPGLASRVAGSPSESLWLVHGTLVAPGASAVQPLGSSDHHR